MKRKVYCVGYQIRNYKSKKDGSDRAMGLLYVLVEKDGITGMGIEEILVFSPQVYQRFTSDFLNSNILVEYRIDGGNAFVVGVELAK